MSNPVSQIQPLGQKYIMFLPNRYFKSTFLKNVYKKLRKNLENLGINLFCLEQFIEQSKKSNLDISFDDKPIPVSNQLYVHLFKNLYYSDSNYNKKQMEKEREHLFLLAGKLGVHEIKYSTDIIESEITNVNLSTDVAKVEGTLSHKKTETKKQGMNGSELYENRGASVYVDDKHDIKKVEEELKKLSDKSSVFSFEFYKQCPKLEAFVLKRCSFRMSKVEYYIESEDISDLSLAVKAYFSEYGLGMSFDKNILSSEKIKYELAFYKDEELEEECVKTTYENQRGNSDPFYSIRKCYENWKDENDKKSILWEIYDYVYSLSKSSYGYVVDDDDINTIHFFNFEELFRFLLKINPDKSQWKNFTHTEEIKDWIEDFFYENFFEQDFTSNEKIQTFLHNSYPNINFTRLQQTIKWLNINWTESDEQIAQTIKNELSNNCKKIDINKSKLFFTVTLGDDILKKGKKTSNSYVIKRTYAPVSRAVKSEVTHVEQLLLENSRLKLEIEADKITIKEFAEKNEELTKSNAVLADRYSGLYESYEQLQSLTNSSKTSFNEKDFEFLNLRLRDKESQVLDQLSSIEELKHNLVKLTSENKFFREELQEKEYQFQREKARGEMVLHQIESLLNENKQIKEELKETNELLEKEIKLGQLGDSEILKLKQIHFELDEKNALSQKNYAILQSDLSLAKLKIDELTSLTNKFNQAEEAYKLTIKKIEEEKSELISKSKQLHEELKLIADLPNSVFDKPVLEEKPHVHKPGKKTNKKANNYNSDN